MEENSKRKMCWNCEGNIAFEEEICPYCRASIIPSLGETSPSKNEAEVDSESEARNEDTAFIATTMALLMWGSFFFIFGCLLLLFSDKGYFVLRWSDHYRYLYFLVSLPMIFIGARNLMKLSDYSQEAPVEEVLSPEIEPERSVHSESPFKKHKGKRRR